MEIAEKNLPSFFGSWSTTIINGSSLKISTCLLFQCLLGESILEGGVKDVKAKTKESDEVYKTCLRLLLFLNMHL